MIDIFDIAQARLVLFLLVLTRVSGVFLVAPVFGSLNVPVMVKIGLAALVSFLLLPAIPLGYAAGLKSALGLALAIGQELLMGLFIGFAVYLIFVAIQLAGQIIDMQMGFGVVNVIDPVTSSQVSVMGQYKFLVATLFFLALNGHHYVLRALGDSMSLVPLGELHLSEGAFLKLSAMFGDVFSVAIKIGAPAIAVLFLTNLSMGLLARTVPQINVFIVGLPLSIAMGLLMVGLCMRYYAYIFSGLLANTWRDVYVLVRALS